MILFEERIIYTGNGNESDVIGRGWRLNVWIGFGSVLCTTNDIELRTLRVKAKYYNGH